MSFVRSGCAGESLRFSAEYFGITMSCSFQGIDDNHTKNGAANRGYPVVDLYDAAGRQSVGFFSLGDDFCRPTSFGSVASPSTMTPTATFGSPGDYPGRHIGKMLHALRQQFRLDVTGPWNIGENLRFCRPGNPIPPTDLGLRCPRLITLPHVFLHRVKHRAFGPY